MLPRVAIVDPELTHSMPPQVTAFTGMDALVQVLEPLVTNQANPLTDAICREGLGRAARSLRRAYEHPDDAAAREDMALASLFGGLALANAKLGAVHGFAGPFGGMFHSPHGAVCAALLPPVMRVNVDALRRRDPEHPALARYTEIARILTGDSDASIEDGVAWVQDLAAALHIPPLSTYGFIQADFPDLMARAARSSSMKGNPVALDEGEMGKVLAMAM